MKISVAARNASLDAMLALLNGGTLQFRTGTAPANVGDTLTGTLLGTLGINATAAAAAASGSATLNAISSDVDADAAGNAGYAVGLSSVAAQVCYFSVGITGSGADIIIDNGAGTLAFEAGGTVSVSSGTISQGAGSV